MADSEGLMGHAFAEGTILNLRTQWQTYNDFCDFFDIQARLPASPQVHITFVTYLARAMRSPHTIAKYLAG